MIAFYEEWKSFRDKDDREARNFLITRYLPLAKYVASTVPSTATGIYNYDDIVSWACIGLIDAIGKFDPSKGVKFETYAISRIKGEISDSLRRIGAAYYPRKKALLDKAYARLHQRLGRPPEDEEMAEELGLDIEKYRSMLSEFLPVYVISLDEELDVEGRFRSAYEKTLADKEFSSVLELSEQKDALSKAIDTLPKRQKEIITLYHYEGLTMREIAEVLELSEGRISQLHTRALLHLRKELAKNDEPDIRRKE